jgi:polyribonucleotide nucleotidyltransferase
MVKVLAIEGNRIKLSRKALIKEQKAKLAQSAPAAEVEESGASEVSLSSSRPRHEFDDKQPKSNQSTILIEGGDDFEEEGGEELDEDNEPNFNRVEGQPVAAGAAVGGGRPAAGNNNNRRRRRRRPGGPGGGRGPGGGGGQA